jgi:CelD/BcsL family acetyltransferase involved in cellulose biosynthesis
MTSEIVSIEIVTTLEQFRQLDQAWLQLWYESNGAPFQNYAWVAAWAQNIDASDQLRIVVVRRNHRLVAVLPMAVHWYYGLRILEWAAFRVTDYCDGLGSPADLMAAWIALRQAGGFDVIRLRNIERGAKVQFLATCPGLKFAEEDEPYLRLILEHTNSDAWVESLHGRKRSWYRRRQRLLKECGTVTFTSYDRVPDKATLVALHKLKLVYLEKHQDKSYLLSDGPERFISLVEALATIGRLHLGILRCDDTIVAGSVAIIHGDTFIGYFTTYNPVFAKASPGNLLMLENIKYAINSGLRVIDYTRGDDDYKREWVNFEMHPCFVTGVATLRGRVALAAYRCKLKLLNLYVSRYPRA